MDKETLLKEWIADLRSGKYQQLTASLGRGRSERCCLGVLCETYIRLGGSLMVTHSGCGLSLEYDGKVNTLPAKVAAAVNLSTESGNFFLHSGYPSSLVNLNDMGVTFEQIADIIESRPDRMFRED